MIPQKNDAKLFWRIDSKITRNLDADSRKWVEHINDTWIDIEYLNFLFHKMFNIFSSKPEDHMFFSSLVVFSNGFYVHLSIVHKLLIELAKTHPQIKKLVSANREFLEKRIEVIRNNVLVHREKPNFYTPSVTISGTDASHLIEYSIMIESDGEHDTIRLRPLEDIGNMQKLLENVERILVALYGEQRKSI